MNHHQRKVLHAIFAHPVNANLDLKDVMGMLTALGADMDAKTKSRIGITLNGQTAVLHLTQHSLLKAEVMQIRKFLEWFGFARAPIQRSLDEDRDTGALITPGLTRPKIALEKVRAGAQTPASARASEGSASASHRGC